VNRSEFLAFGWNFEKGEVEMRKALLMVCAAVFLLGEARTMGGAAAQGAAAQGAADQAEVKIDNFTFTPVTLTVPAGTTVKWVNQDDIPHTVVSEDKRTFKSKALDTDDSFSYTFTQPGTYTYFCSIHPKMTGQVVVK
jgi:plastocyanin